MPSKTKTMFKPTTGAGAPSSVGSPQYKLWNVPQSDPFVGQGAFIVRQGSHDEIYGDYVSAKDAGMPGRAFLMTNAANIPLYAS